MTPWKSRSKLKSEPQRGRPAHCQQNARRMARLPRCPIGIHALMMPTGRFWRSMSTSRQVTATTDFVNTARDAVAVRAHTGHALYLSKGGVVMGTGGNRFGPLGANGLGEKADRWGRVFDGARTMATCSRHSRSRPSQSATRRRLRSARTAASGNGTVASGRAVCVQRDRPQWGLVGHPGDLGASRLSSNLMPVIGFSLASDLGTSRRKRCRLQNCQSDQRHRRSRQAVGSDQRSISRCSASTPSSTPRNLSPNGVKRYSTRGGSSG